MSQTNLKTAVFRLFGPIAWDYADDVTERMLDSRALADTLKRFLRGEMEAGEMAYAIQLIAETCDHELKQGDDGADYYEEHA